MTKRYTAAHWGVYQVTGTETAPLLTGLADDPSPSPIAKGWLDAAQDSRTRILKPAIRKGWLETRDPARRCDDTFVEVDWDTALGLVHRELDRVRRTHTNTAIYAGSYGWASTGRFHHAQSQLRRFLNTIGGFTSARDTYSHAAAEVLLPHITGMTHREFLDKTTDLRSVAEHCELLVAFGGISDRTAQIASSGISRHDTTAWLEHAHARGMEVVLVSPQRTDYAAHCEPEWLSIRPNTDTALMLGLAFEIHRRDRHDKAFLTACCHGWDRFEAYLTGRSDGRPKTPKWAAEICDIAPDAIRHLAARMSEKRCMITVTWGLQRADHGEQPLWMGLTLAAMLGQPGRPGGGFGFGYGSTGVIGQPAPLINWPSLPQGRNPVEDFIPVARLADMLLNPGGEYHYNGAARYYPDIRLVYWVGGNPFHHHQDLFRLERAWTRPETVVVHEPWWTATARRADIVLPVTTPLERRDIMMNRRDCAAVWMDQVIDPIGEARDDHAICAALAERFGTHAAFTEGRSTDAWLRWLWDAAVEAARDAKFTLPDFDAFRQAGIVTVPEATTERILFSDFVEDPDGAPLNTPSGKIEITSKSIDAFNLDDCPAHPQWIEPVEWLGGEGADNTALHLISGQPPDRLHGQLDNGSYARRAKSQGRARAYLHPETAKARGIVIGDIICLSNARGACLAAADLTPDLRRDTVALATGAWFDKQIIDGTPVEVHGNPNVLTIDKGCSSLSQGNIAHTALVHASKWTKPPPPVRVFDPPPGIR